MFQHTDADQPVILHSFFRQVAVIHEVDVDLSFQSQFLDAFLAHGPLFVTQGAPIAGYTVFLCGFNEQEAPAAADIEETRVFFGGSLDKI